jgi:hypothetical protein
MEPPANLWRLFVQKALTVSFFLVILAGKLLIKSVVVSVLVFCAIIAASKPRE